MLSCKYLSNWATNSCLQRGLHASSFLILSTKNKNQATLRLPLFVKLYTSQVARASTNIRGTWGTKAMAPVEFTQSEGVRDGGSEWVRDGGSE